MVKIRKLIFNRGGLRFENLFWETKRGQLVKIVQKQNQIFGKTFFQLPTKDDFLIAQAAKNDCSILKTKLSQQFLFFLIKNFNLSRANYSAPFK